MNEYLDFLKISTPDDLTDNVIKKIESMVRNSKEYRGYLSFIKEHLSIRNCAFFEQIDFVEKKLSIEFHHLITLYNLVTIVGCKMLTELKENEYLLTFDIAKAVIEEHINDNIPGVMLSETVHELVHSGLYQIPSNSKEVHLGNYEKFIRKYSVFLTDNDIKTIKYFLPPEKQMEVDELWQEVNYQKST